MEITYWKGQGKLSVRKCGNHKHVDTMFYLVNVLLQANIMPQGVGMRPVVSTEQQPQRPPDINPLDMMGVNTDPAIENSRLLAYQSG